MFLMSFMLWGGLLAGIPVVIHMIRRQKVTPIEWGAMQFLLETPLKMRRRQRIDHWFLMLLRMAILAALALLLARPMWKEDSFAAKSPMDVGIVLDHSLSMGRRGGAGGGTLFEEGIKSAQRVAALMPPGSTMSVVLAEHTPRAATPLPVELKSGSGDWAKVLERLREMKPGMTDADIPAAVGAANELAQGGRNSRKLVVVISDDQRSNWQVGGETAWNAARSGGKNAEILSLPVNLPGESGGHAANVSVGSVSVSPAFLGINRPAQVIATIANASAGEVGGFPVELTVDGRAAGTQQVSHLAPGQSSTVRFDCSFNEAGSHWVRVKADLVDALEADNAATAAVTVSPRLPVLVVDGQPVPSSTGHYPAAEFLTIAMQPVDPAFDPGSLIAPHVISVSELDQARLQDYPIVVLNDVPRLPDEMVAKLQDYTRNGHGLWIILGARTERDFLNATLGKSGLFPATAGNPIRPRASGGGAAAEPVEIAIRERDNPALQEITAAGQNALSGAILRAWWPLTITGNQMRTVLATTTGDPLATEMDVGRSGGRVIVWTSPVSNLQWNNLPVMPNFVPLVNETLFRLASGQALTQVRQLDAGGTLIWSGPATPRIESATLLGPDGVKRTLQPELRGDKYMVSYKGADQPGLYELQFSPPEIPQPVYYSVNISADELDPAVVSAADVQWLQAHHFLKERVSLGMLPGAIQAQRGGVEMWWLLGLLLLALLVGEVVMTWTLGRRQTDVDPEHAGMIAPVRTAAAQPAVPGGAAR